MLELKNVTKKYLSKTVLEDISLSIPRGQIVGLFGENGAGKSTLMKCVFHFTELTKGSITLDGEEIDHKNFDRLAFATCEHSYFANMTAKQHMEFYEVQFPKFNKKRFLALMEFFNLPMKKVIRTFSTGQKNHFETILALSQGADYIFMDEPFSGSDIFNRDDFYKVLLGILEPHETIVISTHLIEEVKNFIGRALLIKNGTIIGDVTIDELEEDNVDVVQWIREKYAYQSDRVIEALRSSKL